MQDILCNRTLETSYCRAVMMGSTVEFRLLLFCFTRKLNVDIYLNFLGPGRFFQPVKPHHEKLFSLSGRADLASDISEPHLGLVSLLLLSPSTLSFTTRVLRSILLGS